MDRNQSRREFLGRMAVAATSLSAWSRSAAAEQAGIQHTLWVVDRTGPSHLTGQQIQTVLGTIGVLNLAFWFHSSPTLLPIESVHSFRRLQTSQQEMRSCFSSRTWGK